MVSSNQFFDWLDDGDRRPSMHPSPGRGNVLWLSDQHSYVNSLIKKIDDRFGDLVLRMPSDTFDAPDELATTILTAANTAQISEVVVIGHSHFQSQHQLSQVNSQFIDGQATNSFTQRFLKKQHLNQLAKQRLLEVTRKLFSMHDTQVHGLLVSPLFFRVEDGAVCYFNVETNQFEAVDHGVNA